MTATGSPPSRTGPSGGDTEPSSPRRDPDLTGWVLGAGYAVALFALGATRVRNNWATAWDLSLFDQGLWLLSRGREPEMTLIGDNLFADHLSIVLAGFAPLYRLEPTPMWLLAAQALALGATVPVLRAVAAELGASSRLAATLTVGSAPLLAAAIYDFHPSVLAAPLLGLAVLAGLRNDRRLATWAAVGVAIVRADLAVALLGVAIVSSSRVRRRLLWLVPVPLLAGTLIPAALGTHQTFQRYYSTLGTDPLDALVHPWRMITTLVAGQAPETLVIWLLPVGFLTLLRWRWALATAVGGLPLLLSTAGATSMPWFHHAATMVPFTVAGALAAVARPPRWWPTRVRPEIPGLVGLALALALASPLSPRAAGSIHLPTVLSPRPLPGIDAISERIGPDESVSADAALIPFLDHRTGIYPFPCPAPELAGARCHKEHGEPPDVVAVRAELAPGLRRAGWRVDPVPAGAFVTARP